MAARTSVAVAALAVLLGLAVFWLRSKMDPSPVLSGGGPTWQQVLETGRAAGLSARPLHGRIAVVTGANTGIGLETAVALATAGAHVIVASRSPDKGRAAAELVRAAGSAEFMQVDLASLASVRGFAKAVIERHGRVEQIVLNAGVDAMAFEETGDGIEMNWGVNHVAGFELVRALLPALRASNFTGPAERRVVVLTSSVHWLVGQSKTEFDLSALPMTRANFPGYLSSWPRVYMPLVRGYALSKAANILFVKELGARLAPEAINTYAAHPGVVVTTIGVPRFAKLDAGAGLAATLATLWTNALAATLYVGSRMFWFAIPGKKSLAQGAATTVHCCLAPGTANETGLYYYDAAVAPAAPLCQDAGLARELWAHTEALIAQLAH